MFLAKRSDARYCPGGPCQKRSRRKAMSELMTERNTKPIQFSQPNRRQVTVDYNGGRLTVDSSKRLKRPESNLVQHNKIADRNFDRKPLLRIRVMGDL